MSNETLRKASRSLPAAVSSIAVSGGLTRVQSSSPLKSATVRFMAGIMGTDWKMPRTASAACCSACPWGPFQPS